MGFASKFRTAAEKSADTPMPPTPRGLVLLREIRDSLKK